MKSLNAMIGVVLLGLTASGAEVWSSQGGQAQAPPPAATAAGAPAPGQGRGGGRGNPMAQIFNDVCATCHGNTAAPGPRAPSLLADKFTQGSDDESIARHIRDGFPEKGMVPFKDLLTDQQIWAMVAYLRTQTANLKEKPVYVPDPDGQVISSEKQTFKMEIVARNLETPWGLAFLPDGRLLITERPGRLRIVKDGKLLPDPVKGTPKVWEKQDGGLLDVEVHPQYARNGWIYLSYSETLPGYVAPPPPPPPAADAPPPPAPTGRGGRGGPPDPPSMTVIVRGKINKDNEWVEQQVLFRAPGTLYNSSNAHYGSRFTFDRQNHLFFSLGEKQQMLDAQDLSKATGKIHRVNDDGTVPADNPFAKQSGALPTIWSYGHRNPQGLAWDPVTGKLWETEHGPTGGDEVNIIEPGHNYGWGVATMGIQNGITKRTEPGMDDPIVYYTPTIAPSGITFYTGDKYPGWKNSLFVSALAGQQLRRLETSGGKVVQQEAVFNQFGRVHDVIAGPDGLLYVTLQLPGQSLSQSTPGMVGRLVPVRK
jgi:glucose/arabinose dehydrogenase